MAVRRLIVALAFLTRLPMPRITPCPDDFAAAVRLYPVVGIVVGALVAGAGWLGAWADPWLGALAALLAWVWITGALHLDGLADLADGLGAAHGNRERLLAVMADPHVGSFGVVAFVLMLATKLVLLHLLLPAHWDVIVAAIAAARTGPLCWAGLLPPLKTTGLAAAIGQASGWPPIAAWALIVMALAIRQPWLLVTPVLILGFVLWAKRRLGGMTGDVHGAGIELVEAGLLIAGLLYRTA